MKKILLILIIVSVSIAIIASLNDKPTLVETSLDNAPPVTNSPPRAEVKKNSGKVLAVMPQEYKNEKKTEAKLESSVPWDELDARWMDELKTFIMSLDPETGEDRFHKFTLIRQKWNAFNKLHSIETRKLTLTERTVNNNPMVTDKKAYDKLVQQWIKAYDDYKRQTRTIFGKHFDEVKEFNSGFNQSIQSYGRDPEVPLGIDPAFMD